MISKMVYSQTENHALAFALLGMAVALLRRHKTELGQLPPIEPEEALFRPASSDFEKDWERKPIYAS